MGRMNRRAILGAAAAGSGGALFAPVLRAMDAAEAAPGAHHDVGGYGRSGALAPRDLSLISGLSEIIIPETDTPGAGGAGVPAFIEHALTNFFEQEELERYRRGLEALDDLARASHGEPFMGCSDTERVSLVDELDRRAFTAASDDDGIFFYRMHKQLTITGYYTSRIGETVELHVAPFGALDADLPLDDVGRTWA
jgi:hypothetical protein